MKAVKYKLQINNRSAHSPDGKLNVVKLNTPIDIGNI